MDMKKISLFAIASSAALMTACTDYVSKIEDLQQEREQATADALNALNGLNNNSSTITSSGCTCTLENVNLSSDPYGNLYYDYALHGDDGIYWKVDGCNTGYIITPRKNSTYSGNTEAGLYLDETPDVSLRSSLEFNAKVTVGGPYSRATVGVEVGVSNPNFGETIWCPTVNVFGMNNSSSSVSTGSTACGDLWCGIRDGSSRANTGFAKTENNGYWYTFTDHDDNGNSEFTYPVDPIIGSVNYFDPIIQQYGGIKGTVTLQDGYQYPYAGLGFDLVSGNREGVDVTDWLGLCIVYQSTTSFYLKIPIENEATVVEYDNYRYKLPRKSEMTTVDIVWDSFKQGGFGPKIDRLEALKMVAAVVLEFNDDVGSPEDFFIQSIGRYGTCQ